jgi:hypothetical protein
MRPPEEEIRRLVAEWIKKADLDFSTSVRLSAEPEFRDMSYRVASMVRIS